MRGVRPSKALPICALVFGCLGFIPVCGLAAVILGIVVLASRRPGKRMAAVGLVLGLTLPVVSGYFLLRTLAVGRELSRQSVCVSNLHEIGKAITTYKAENRLRTPRLHRRGDPVRRLHGDSHVDELWGDDGKATRAIGTAAMQNLWLLIARDLVSPKTFVCPSDEHHVDRPSGLRRYGWTQRRQVSYGLHYPYDGPERRGHNPAPWTHHLDEGMVILADQNPASLRNEHRGKGVQAWVVAPSNHPDFGEAALRAGGDAGFHRKPKPSEGVPEHSRFGLNGDDVYTPGGDGIPGKHTGTFRGRRVEIPGEIDTYIVPTTDK